MSKKEDINKDPLSENEVAEEQLNPETEATAEPQQQNEVEKLQGDLALEKDKFLRLFAEFENYKKRTSRERVELYKTAGQDVMSSLLPVLDDFDRALIEISKT